MRNLPPKAWAALSCLALGSSAFAQDYRDFIDYTKLQTLLGGSTPNGAGVIISQIEAPEAGGGFSVGLTRHPTVTFTNGSGAAGAESGHANSVAIYMFQLDPSLGPNLTMSTGVTQAKIYNVVNGAGGSGINGWIESASLNMQTNQLPVVQTSKVENHSWIGEYGDARDSELLRRHDFQIRRDNFLSFVGTNNAADNIPRGMASGFNSIAVGSYRMFRTDRPDPFSSVGPTVFETPGRSKPDIMVPMDNRQAFVSQAVPIASSAGALLTQVANSLNADAQRVEVLKAVILNGASKEPFGGNWTRFNNGSYVEPLDRRYGAGLLNIYNSHQNLAAGEYKPSNVAYVNSFGWDLNTVGTGQTNRYFVNLVDANATASITLSWLRRITAAAGNLPADPLTFTGALANLDIRLLDATGFVVGTLRDSSVSPIDNVEHIYFRNLAAGQYVIEVIGTDTSPIGGGAETYGLAWTFSVPEPGTYMLIGVATTGVLAVYGWRKRKNKTRQEMEPEEFEEAE